MAAREGLGGEQYIFLLEEVEVVLEVVRTGLTGSLLICNCSLNVAFIFIVVTAVSSFCSHYLPFVTLILKCLFFFTLY